MTKVDIRPFDPHEATRADWTAYHAFRRMRHAEDDPGEPIDPDDECEYNLQRHWPNYENRRIAAWADGAMVGIIGFGFRRLDTLDYEQYAPFMHCWGGVLEPWRRLGVATALLGDLHDFMAERSKTTATFWTRQPEGHAFLNAIGAELKQQGVENRLQFAGLDWDELARWRADADASGLPWEIHAPRIPFDRMAEILPQVNVLFLDVPQGSLETPPLRWELTGMRTYYEELDRHDGAHYLVMLMTGDEIAALCEASWDSRYPDRAYQNLTAVARSHRGKGLAKGVKAAMLLMIREKHPGVTLMITGNAQSNAAMLAINHRLGFTEYKRDGTYQIGPEALAKWLEKRSA